MFKKTILLIALAIVCVTPTMAEDPIVLVPITTGPVQGQPHRSPIPEFYLDGYTLTAGSYTVGSTVELKDEDGDVVFTTYIYVEGDTIVLPSTLSGTYTIEVTRGSQTFVGEIVL